MTWQLDNLTKYATLSGVCPSFVAISVARHTMQKPRICEGFPGT